MAQRHTVYLWDMPGYGESSKFDGQDVSLAVQAMLWPHWLIHGASIDPSSSHTTTAAR
ncbi:hypothetical protein [Gordonia sp. GN26]